MSRVINPDSAGKQRTQQTKAIVLAIRELMKQGEPNETTKDLAAFIGVTLVEIGKTVEVSVQAWEKRGYWLKADRFRLEWEWAETMGKAMQKALLADDWAQVAQLAAKIALKLNKITIAERNRIGTPWVGFWKQLTQG
jgi:hypothetical protein